MLTISIIINIIRSKTNSRKLSHGNLNKKLTRNLQTALVKSSVEQNLDDFDKNKFVGVCVSVCVCFRRREEEGWGIFQ